MLARFHRLNFRLQKDRDLFRFGKFQQEKNFQLAYDFKGENFQFSVMVPKKIISSAAARNALRRTITTALPREFVEFNNLRLAIKITSRDATLLKQTDWKNFFDNLFKKLSVQ
ncbi:MAG: hypothetical protein A2383_00415 [Candidatus Pacebacteria bacterium RIFOXYB1_FULL_39_46]|nr:MAG: hypothetical protein A2182_00245 [Candidatus Pacebacteria bacterium RIFOXYA1_FULL_38_18]OGJ38051.1 MAG: hypothetical protein A2383_00415 [Candidatus Pacebacteria bacterium RIFOXYB1_FULL_39_46]OGJ39726.1 MAG: hypothetical protein A2411_03030 [Candidatus Pacebacteria bacterium RIFOXYC1_FULL_39_21]OGJ39803.1 MAG: hypothetical protein A2582_00180 [Candidatus Pacebacteria bacterium RIFOXYD1_FULL_39_27]